MIKLLLSSGLLLLASALFALDATVYINRDTLTTNGANIAACRFNSAEDFNRQNATLQVGVGELLSLTVVNNDVLQHTFTIDGILESDNLIDAGESSTFSIQINQLSAHRFYSNKPYGDLIGASGLLMVGFETELTYFWNLQDTQAQLSHELSDGLSTEIPDNYVPELFFINGFAFPQILDDPNTAIEVTLNDTVMIAVASAGNMDHMLHWHGFHVEIMYSSYQPERIGWIKDTFPVKRGDTMILRLVPDQLGQYPVHDHNLIAVTNLGIYPGGMITRVTVVE